MSGLLLRRRGHLFCMPGLGTRRTLQNANRMTMTRKSLWLLWLLLLLLLLLQLQSLLSFCIARWGSLLEDGRIRIGNLRLG